MIKKIVLLSLLTVVLGCQPSLESSSESNDDKPPAGEVTEDTVTDNDDACAQDTSPEEPEPEEEPSRDWVTWTDCSQIPGDHPCDFTFVDQNGDNWSLYDNYPTVMVIDFSTMWCSVCKNIAPAVQGHVDDYVARGYDFMWVTVLVEDATGDAPELSEIQDWANTYGMTTSPVLAGNRADVVDLSAQSGYPITAWPTLVVIDNNMVLTQGINGWNEATVFGWVDEALGITP